MQDLEFMQFRPNGILPAGCLLTAVFAGVGATEDIADPGVGGDRDEIWSEVTSYYNKALNFLEEWKSLMRSPRLHQDGEVGEPQERLYAADLHEFSQNIADLGAAGHDEIGNEMASYYNEAVKSLEEWKSLVSFA